MKEFLKKNPFVKCLLYVTLGVICLLIILLPIKYYFSENRNNTVCQEEIRKILKSPSTAKFSNYEKLSNGDVFYDVDAQNNYGAMIREVYLCRGVNINDEITSLIEVKSMEGDTRERYKKALSTCEEARQFSEEGLMSGSDVNIICKEFISVYDKEKAIDERVKDNSKEICEQAKKNFNEGLYTQKDVDSFCSGTSID